MTNDFNLQLQLYSHQKPFMLSPNKKFGGLPTYFQSVIPEHKYMLKVNGSNARENCETWSKLTIKTPERRHQSVYVKVARELKEISTLRQCQSNYIVQKKQFSIQVFFSKCDQIPRKLSIFSHSLEKFLNGKLHVLVSVDYVYFLRFVSTVTAFTN